jgi:hypothetical protein
MGSPCTAMHPSHATMYSCTQTCKQYVTMHVVPCLNMVKTYIHAYINWCIEYRAGESRLWPCGQGQADWQLCHDAAAAAGRLILTSHIGHLKDLRTHHQQTEHSCHQHTRQDKGQHKCQRHQCMHASPMQHYIFTGRRDYIRGFSALLILSVLSTCMDCMYPHVLPVLPICVSGPLS